MVCSVRQADKLKQLTISVGDLESLQCFAAGRITESLEALTIEGHAPPPSELAHLSALRRLRTLFLISGWAPRLDEATIASLSPPTPRLPALTALIQQWRSTNDEWAIRECHGASFEWLQERRLQ